MKQLNSKLGKKYKSFLNDINIKYISFDIFDTLVFRKLNNPVDIFEKMALNEYVIDIFENKDNFSQLRKTAEKFARKNSNEEEITLFDIYNQFTYLSKEEKDKLIEIELNTEQKYLIVNSEIEYWIEEAFKFGKKVILVSDMYISRTQLEKIILKKIKKYNLFENIFISSDLKKTKHNGTMFDFILKKYNLTSREILHIGDNFLADISSANIRGINTIYYNYDHIISEQLKNEKLYPIVYPQGSLSIRHLSTLSNPYTNEKDRFFYNFGTTIIAPMLWSFSHWLLEICLKNDFYDINFLLREGKTFKKYFDLILKNKELNQKFSLKDIHISRKALFLPSLNEKDYHLNNMNFNLLRDWKVKDLYNRLDLTIDNKKINKIKNKVISELKETPTYIQMITDDLIKNKNKISENKNKQLYLFLEYWKSLNITTNSLVFDFGANSSMHKKINEIVDDKLTNVLFYRTKAGFENSLYQKQYTYLAYNERNSYKIELLRRTPDIFEILLNGQLGTTLGYKKKGNLTKPIIDKTKMIDNNTIVPFEQGIDNYFKLAKQYNQKGDIFSSDTILDLLTRVIELPTTYEAKYLGELLINISDNGSKMIPIISKKSINEVKRIGKKKLLQNVKNDLYKDWKKIPWVQGAITVLKPNFIKQTYMYSEDVNQSHIKSLLKELEKKRKISEASVYGAGDFFLKLLPELLLRNIKVKYLIETKPVMKDFLGYKILSPEEVVLTNENTFIIASGVFSKVMSDHIKKVYKLNDRKIPEVIGIDLN